MNPNEKLLNPSTYTLVTALIYIFGYITLNSSLQSNYSIHYFEPFDLRYVSSGLLFFVMVLIVAVPSYAYIFTGNPKKSKNFNKPLSELTRLLLLLFTLGFVLMMYESIILGKMIGDPLIQQTLVRRSTLFIIFCFALPIIFISVLMIILNTTGTMEEVFKSLDIRTMENIIKGLVATLFIIVFISSLFVYSFITLLNILGLTLFVVFYKYILLMSTSKHTTESILVNMLIYLMVLCTYSILFGKSILPLVRPELSPIPNQDVCIYLTGNLPDESISGSLVFESARDYYIVLDNEPNVTTKLNNSAVWKIHYIKDVDNSELNN